MPVAVRHQCDLTCGVCSAAASTFMFSNIDVYDASGLLIGSFDGDEQSSLNCSAGMQGESCDVDIDECLVAEGGCAQICINTVGGFSCSCYTGYSATSETTCDDIDECSVSNAGCTGTCYNSQGSFFCRCEGWSVLSDNGYDCECNDFDELIRASFLDGAGNTVKIILSAPNRFAGSQSFSSAMPYRLALWGRDTNAHVVLI